MADNFFLLSSPGHSDLAQVSIIHLEFYNRKIKFKRTVNEGCRAAKSLYTDDPWFIVAKPRTNFFGIPYDS